MEYFVIVCQVFQAMFVQLIYENYKQFPCNVNDSCVIKFTLQFQKVRNYLIFNPILIFILGFQTIFCKIPDQFLEVILTIPVS